MIDPSSDGSKNFGQHLLRDWLWAATGAMSIAGYGAISYTSLSLPGLYSKVTLGFRALVCVLSIVCFAASLARRSRTSWPAWFLMTFFALYALRMIGDTRVLGEEQLQKQVLFLAGVCLIPAIAMLRSPGIAAVSKMLSLSMAILMVTSSLGILSIRTGSGMETGRLMANEFLNPIDLGHSGLMLLLISVHRLMRVRVLKAFLPSLLVYGAGILVGALALGLSGSRGPVTAGLLCLCVLAIGSSRWPSHNLKNLRRVTVVLAIIVGVAVGVAYTTSSGGRILERVSGLQDTQSDQSEVRFDLYREALQAIADNPVVGATTMSSIGLYPHNVILEAGMALGMAAAAAIVLFLGACLIRSVRMAQSESDLGIIALLAVQQIIGAQFSGAIWSDDLLWVTCMLVFGLPLKALVRHHQAIVIGLQPESPAYA